VAKIQILSDEVAKLIAAGEVVERPVSVVKELVENSVDAGATRIAVELERGGISLIRVTDNGCGMGADDLPKAFLRHATSKIATKYDLAGIKTLGFRGEALASVAAVSRVSVTTRAAGAESGMVMQSEGGKILDIREAGCPQGTDIMVRDLFFNTPARVKFLRRDAAEAAAVSALLRQLALGNPGISFSLLRDGRSVFKTAGDGDLSAALRVLHGGELACQMTWVEGEWEQIGISGLISLPSAQRRSRLLQSFFINGRFIRSKTCAGALEDAYKGRLMTGRFPSCVLFLNLDAGAVDVNVHPAKLEVRFSNEREIYNAVYVGCLSALERLEQARRQQVPFPITAGKVFGVGVGQKSIGLLKDESDLDTPLPALDSAAWTQNLLRAAQSAQDNGTGISENFQADAQSSARRRERQTELLEFSADTVKNKSVESGSIFEEQESPSVLGEVFNTFIAASFGDRFYLIDKHAAHERYIYERLRADGILNAGQRQVLLSPMAVSLSWEDCAALCENLETVEAAGLLIEPFGENTVIIREAALVFDGFDLEALLAQVAESLKGYRKDITPEKFDELLFSLSCRAAVMSGDKSKMPELESLASSVLRGDIRHCPHGRPAVVEFSRGDIEKMFGRKG
jgi:DNA mismatch repair protein MutL